MKIIGKIKRLENGDILITPTRYLDFKYDSEKEYSVDIEKLSNRRTLNQNRYLWALINEICMEEDGNISNAESKYCELLKMANAKSTMIYIKENAFAELHNLYRNIAIRGKSKDYLLVQVFYGSSQMDTKEMAQLIDTTIDYAYQIGCPNARYYEEMLERNK